jgi:NAD(P)-dependent dehydrogenase (short-subunit alcohol dehydrogenase family)
MDVTRQSKYDNPFIAILTGLSDLFRRKKPELSLEGLPDLHGKKVLITGASSGLGLATAVQMAIRGAEVIMAVRSGIPSKGIEVKTRSGSDKVHMIYLDLMDLGSIENFAKEIKNRFGHIDVFISNAAMVAKEGRETKYGLDQMFVVNYFAKFILVKALIRHGCLEVPAPGKPRIVIVASESHRNAAAFDWEGFGRFSPYGISRAVSIYGYYKLLLLTMANELARRLNTDGMVRCPVLALCPGPVNSNIAREAPALFQPLLRLVFSMFFSSPEKASQPVVYLAAAKELEARTMEYLFMMNKKEMDPKATDPENGQRLWDLTEQLYKDITDQVRGAKNMK